MSSGAVEVLAASGRLSVVRNMPKFLAACVSGGWDVIGAAMAPPRPNHSEGTVDVGTASQASASVLVMVRREAWRCAVQTTTPLHVFVWMPPLGVFVWLPPLGVLCGWTCQGNEGFGLRTNVLRECSHVMAVPMDPGTTTRCQMTECAVCNV